MLPQKNATLTAIAGGGFSEDEGGGYGPGADTAKWTGSVKAYVHEEVLTEPGPTGLNAAKETYIVIPADVTPDVLPEDTVTFTYQGAAQTRIARHVEAHTLPGHNQTARIYLRET